MVTAGVSVVAAVGDSVVAALVALDVPLGAAVPPVAGTVPLIGARTITARAKQTLFCPLLLALLFLPLPVSRLEFMCRKVAPGKHSANTVTRAPVPRPLTDVAAPVLPDELLVPVPELPLVPGVAVAVVPPEAGVAVLLGAAVVGEAVALLLELLELELLELLLEPLLELLLLPPVLATNDVAPQPHIRVVFRKMYVCGPLAVSIVSMEPGE